MRTRPKRQPSRIVVVVAALLVLAAACSGDDDESTTPSTTSAPAEPLSFTMVEVTPAANGPAGAGRERVR